MPVHSCSQCIDGRAVTQWHIWTACELHGLAGRASRATVSMHLPKHLTVLANLLPHDVLWLMHTRELCERFVHGIRVRRNAARLIRDAVDRHLYGDVPDLIWGDEFCVARPLAHFM